MQQMQVVPQSEMADSHRASANSFEERSSATAQFPAPAQLALDGRIVAGLSKRDDVIGDITRMVHAYNFGLRSKTPSERIDELHEIEHRVYAWFNENKTQDISKTDFGPKMKLLLSNILTENETVVGISMMTVNAPPPVANFETLKTDVKARVTAIWNDLINGTGNIAIQETQTYTSTNDGTQKTKNHPGFRIQVLTNFARLLSTAFGRQLVGEVNAGANGHIVTIRPGLSVATDDVPAEEFQASASDPEESLLQELEHTALFGKSQPGSKAYMKKQKNVHKLYPEEKLTPKTGEKRRLMAGHNLQKKPGTEGFRMREGSQWRYFKFGAGSPSVVTMTSDVRDGSEGPMSRFVDSEGDEIIVPVFITLGHELGHALHTIRGAQTGHTSTGYLNKQFGKDVNLGEYSSTLEEVVTIRGVENTLRREHGITERHSHHNVISLLCKKIKDGPLENAFSEVDKLPQPFRGHLTQLLNQVNSIVSQNNNAEASEQALAHALNQIELAKQQIIAIQEQKNKEENSFLNRMGKVFDLLHL